MCPLIDYPNCIYYDWMHCWCASGGIGQCSPKQICRRISQCIGTRKVRLPSNLQRLSRHWFRDIIVEADEQHARAFASEVLTATVIVGFIVQVVLKPAGLLLREIACFEAMQIVFAYFKRTLRTDIPAARRATLLHNSLFSELYPECQKPKLHYCIHVIDSWEYWGELLQCFGAEHKHKDSYATFRFCYNRGNKSALAYEVRRMFHAAEESSTFEPAF